MANVKLNLPNYPSVVDRYFASILPSSAEHHRILQHSNGICVLTLADSHPILAEKKTVDCVNYQVTMKLNRLQNKVIGKNKRGGQILQPESIICRMTCTDGSCYVIRACIKAKLIEVNEKLIENPNLILSKPTSSGYIAIMKSTGKSIITNVKNEISIEDD